MMRARVPTLVLVATLAACGGGGTASAPPVGAPAGAQTVTLSIAIPQSVPASAGRKPAYISSATGYVTATVAPAPPGVTQPQSIPCTPAGAPTSCSGPVTVLPGNDTFTVNLYASNQTTLLSTGQSAVNITTPGQSVSLTFNPVLAGMLLRLPPGNVTAGTSSSTPLTLQPLDPANNIIVAQPSVSPAPVFVDAAGNPVTVTLSIVNTQPTNGAGTVTFPGGATTMTLTAPPAAPIQLAYNGQALLKATIAATGISASIAPATLGVTPTIKTFPAGVTAPGGIAAGPDGNVWFTAQGHVGIITPATDAIALVPAPNADSSAITAWNGKLWFAEHGASKLGALTTGTPVLSEVNVPSGGPTGLAVGSDGNLYFTESGAGKVGYVAAATSTVTECGVALSAPYGIVSGPDGNLWIVENGVPKISTIKDSSAGPTCTAGPSYAFAAGGSPQWIATDGTKLYITQSSTNGGIVPLTTAGTFGTTVALPTGALPTFITFGSDGQFYVMNDLATNFSLATYNAATGALGSYATSPGPALPLTDWIAAGPDGNMWFTQQGINSIGEILL